MYSLQNGLAFLHKYTSMERQGHLTKPPCLAHLSSFLGHTWVSRVLDCAARPGVASAVDISSTLWGLSSRLLPPDRTSLPGAWGAPITGMPTGSKVFLAILHACGQRPCNRTHLKKLFVPYSLVRWGTWQIHSVNTRVWPPSPVVWGAFRPAVFRLAWLVRV